MGVLEEQKQAHNKQQSDYSKYVDYCKSLNKEPRNYYDWNYCTYSANEEHWRINDKFTKI